MNNTNPFKTFRVFPSYGFGRATVEWELNYGVSGQVFIYSSPNGFSDWTLLNPEDPGDESGTLIDTALPTSSIFGAVHYRGLLDNGENSAYWLVGPPVAFHDNGLSRREYALVRNMMRQEYRTMARGVGSGTKAFHCVPRESGTPSLNYDSETDQQTGPDCAGSTDDAFDMPWQGGFHTPVQTWVRVISSRAEKKQQEADAAWMNEEATVSMRLLAFPRPRRGHMLVLPGDDRYLLEEAVEAFLFRGFVPVAWHVKAALLERHDPRYRLPVPEFAPDPA